MLQLVGCDGMFLFPLWVTRCSLSASVQAKVVHVEAGGAKSGKRHPEGAPRVEVETH